MMGPQVLNSFNAQVIQFLLVAKYMVAPVMLLPCCTDMQFLRLIVRMRVLIVTTVYLVYKCHIGMRVDQTPSKFKYHFLLFCKGLYYIKYF